MDIIEQAQSILSNSNKLATSTNPEVENVLIGYSGLKLINLLKELSLLSFQTDNSCYLEVGVFQGLTLLSVASYASNLSCYGIDNFAFFDPEKKNLNLIEERKKKLNVDNAYLINKDYEDALENLQQIIGNKKIGVYFVDGPHDYRSQLMCLQLAIPYLNENSLIVIDDCNYAHVRQANRDFLVTHPEFKLLFQSYTRCHPKNMDEQEREEVANQGWWNGINVLVKDPHSKLEIKFPPTIRERKLYENEHYIHSCKIAEEVPKLISFSQNIGNKNNLLKNMKQIIKFWAFTKQVNKKYNDRFTSMNTNSLNLPFEDITKFS